MFWKQFFKSTPRVDAARELYAAIVAQARQEGFYAALGVPDTLDGRFDLITLHAVLVMDRLGQSADAKTRNFAQIVFDEMFSALDMNLREMGVGDLSISKRVKKMAEVFYGRAGVYRMALKAGDDKALAKAIARNIYPEGAPKGAPERLARYVQESGAGLAKQKESDLLAARVSFPKVPESLK